jgi:hypothetical protein
MARADGGAWRVDLTVQLGGDGLSPCIAAKYQAADEDDQPFTHALWSHGRSLVSWNLHGRRMLLE